MRPYKLAADSMLGGLAKWLRLLGIDTLYLAQGPKPVHRDRILITRRSQQPDQKIPAGWLRVVRITANTTSAQLRETVEALPLRQEDIRPLTICSVCNEALERVSPQAVADRVWPYVLATQKTFSLCPGCGRIYWPATHYERITKVINEVIHPHGATM
jgi:uncharacterized protein with PIN domain